MTEHGRCAGIILSALVSALTITGHSLAGVASQNGDNQVEGGGLIGPVQPGKESNERTGKHDEHNLNWETGAGRSYLIPGFEVLAYLFLLNQFNRHYTEPTSTYETNGDTIWHNLTDSKWVIDDDQFSVNQFLHPYSGSIYYGFARSA